MKYQIILMLVALIAAALACDMPDLSSIQRPESITGSGNVITREEAITGFEEVEVSQGFEVDIQQGEPFSVVLRVDDNLVEHLKVVKQGDTLLIGLETNRNYPQATLQAEVTMPVLTSLKLKTGSQATASGSGTDLTIEASEGSDADLSAFAIENATVSAVTGSHVTVNVSGKLDADAQEGSTIYYLGNPAELTTNTSEGAEILPK